MAVGELRIGCSSSASLKDRYLCPQLTTGAFFEGNGKICARHVPLFSSLQVHGSSKSEILSRLWKTMSDSESDLIGMDTEAKAKLKKISLFLVCTLSLD